jgi:hypothetical protein
MPTSRDLPSGLTRKRATLVPEQIFAMNGCVRQSRVQDFNPCNHAKSDLVECLFNYPSEIGEKTITITAIRGAVHYRKHCRF